MLDTSNVNIGPRYPFDLVRRFMLKPHINRFEYIDVRTALITWYDYHLDGGWEEYLGYTYSPTMQFVNYQLTTEQKEEAKALYCQDSFDLFEAAARILVQDYKLSCTYASDQRCFIVSLIGRREGHQNYDMCMTSRHGSYEVAMAYLVYKELNVFNGLPWAKKAPETDWG